MFVVGTAGHVDHGKSTLLQLLTGFQPDRLPEEKKRGMTIELNFVWWESSDFGRVGFVDVPGHERFVKNMISGAALVDAFLFVVAADDGWMPQSEEHLRLLHGLGINDGVVVVTKTDLVPSVRNQEVLALVREKFSSLGMTEVPILSFSAREPSTLSPVKENLNLLLKRLPRPEMQGSPRIWVDRVFIPKGQGVVVTGTLREGVIAKGQEIFIPTRNAKGTVKSIQTYAIDKSEVIPNSRVALQLARINADEISRGDLITGPGGVGLTDTIDVALQAFGVFEPKRSTRLNFQLGTMKVSGRWSTLSIGEFTFGRIRFDRKLPIRNREKFILRTSGDDKTIGVGTVVDIAAARVKLSVAKKSLEAGALGISGNLQYHLNHHGIVDASFFRDSLLGNHGFESGLAAGAISLGRSIWVDKTLWSESAGLLATKSDWAETDFLRSLRRDPALSLRLCDELVKQGIAVREAGRIRVKGDQGGNPEEKKRVQTIWDELQKKSSEPSDLTALLRDVGFRSTIQRLTQEKKIHRLQDNHFLLDKTYQTFQALIQSIIKSKGSATTSELKEAMNLSRKFAVLVLEKFDGDRLTYLKDGVRRLLK